MSEELTPKLAEAYSACREIARREAKNFYYAFRVLPRPKSDAMCAVYAFMRRADDLADDETRSLEERRAAMAEWTTAWRGSRVEGTHDPIFLALNDTQRRFGIGDKLLEQLVLGMTLDLEDRAAGVAHVAVGAEEGRAGEEVQVYETFDDLYRYCYLVASVVGLVCIRIFGYAEARAELLAEHVGIAFQLTNILRDVKEDAERGRVYLPLGDMAVTGVELEEVVAATRGGAVSGELVGLLKREIQRAAIYYADAEGLIPLLDADSQPAMRVLVTIYSELLERIAGDPAKVFRRRVSVPTGKKLAILTRGMIASMRARGSA
ncbi:MAG TPA: phytoene/squalene synthase family protein [Acidobacteriaceae bacterium]|jgi:phytoene synthase|nr:phytoene/squalene synthase family protein [Acidobacteriaceae bacterium]